MSFVDDEEAFNTPRWVATMAGLAFGFVGLFLFKTALADRGLQNPKSVFNLVLVALLLTCLGSIVTWVSLGPGERAFESTISIPFISLSGNANEVVGRLCFLPGAIVLDAGAAILWFHVRRRLVCSTGQVMRQPGQRVVFIAGLIVLMVAVSIFLAATNALQYLPGRQ